jgi:hypothetical protein
VLAVAVLTLLPAQAPADLAERAATAFEEGVALRGTAEKARPRFREAAELYEELRRRGVRSAALYRNLGNASLLADDVPRAVLAYRRGMRLAPDDADLQPGLAAARERVAAGPEGTASRAADDRPPWLPRLRPAWLFWAAVLCYALACGGVTRWLMTRTAGPLWLAGIALVGAAALGMAVVWQARLEADEAARPLVVIAEDVYLRLGDGPGYPKRYEAPLAAGTETRLLSERGGWLQVEVADGTAGWVPAAACLVDRDE